MSLQRRTLVVDLSEGELIDVYETGDVQAVRRLLQHGADVNQLIDGKTSLMWACRSKSIEIIKLLLESSVDVHRRSYLGFTALHCAALHGNTEAIKLLCEHGAQVNVTNKDGNSALHLAALHRRSDCMRLLLNYGVQVNMRDNWGKTPLFYAKTVEAIQILLDAGAVVNEQDGENNTPLHKHAKRGRLECAKILLENNADHTIDNKKGKTVLDAASTEIKQKLQRFIEDRVRTKCKRCSCSVCVNEHKLVKNQSSEIQSLSGQLNDCVNHIQKLDSRNQSLEENVQLLGEQLSSCEGEMKKLEVENKSLSAKMERMSLGLATDMAARDYFTEDWRERFNRIDHKAEKIVTDMDPGPTISHLYSNYLLTEEQYQEARSLPYDMKKAKYLLGLITQGPKYLDGLKQALEKNHQPHIAKLLD